MHVKKHTINKPTKFTCISNLETVTVQTSVLVCYLAVTPFRQIIVKIVYKVSTCTLQVMVKTVYKVSTCTLQDCVLS